MHSPLTSLKGNRVGLAKKPLSAQSRFLYHKTTHRALYQQALKESNGCQDVILWNEEGFITESCVANIVIDYQGAFITPPSQHGLLPGVLRRALLEKGRIQEKLITKKDLLNADHIFLINSVRGWMALEKNQEEDAVWIISDIKLDGF